PGSCSSATGVCSNPAKASGTACNDSDACTTADHCDTNAACVGTLTCLPGVPGAVSAPGNSTTGSYVVSWGASTGVVSGYELYENGVGIFSGGSASRSISIN